MVSSRDGAAKGLNGFDPNAIGEGAKAPDSPPPQLAGLVDELAQALGVARENLGVERRIADDRRTFDPVEPVPVTKLNPAPSVAPSPAPAALPVAMGRHLFDDEEDDAHMPIPSTWRAPPEPPKATGTFNDQLRAAGLGFATGLALVVPAVLLLTGKLGDLPFSSALYGTQQAKRSSASTTPPSTSVAPSAQNSYSASAQSSASAPTAAVSYSAQPPAATPPQSSAQAVPGTVLQSPAPQRSVITAVVAPTKVEPEPQPPTVEVKSAPPPAPSWSEAIAEGKQRISAGDIVGARDVLSKPATADNAEALLILGETYDPNMLAAWGARGATADVAIARSLYGRALAAGAESARARIKALE